MRIQLAHAISGIFPAEMIMDLEDGGWTMFGIAEWKQDQWFPVVIKVAGRERLVGYFVDGHVEDLYVADVGPAVYEAIDVACTALWGHAWNAAVAELSGLNRRTFQRDRISRYLLPPQTLSTLAFLAAAEDGEELAKMLLAVAAYHRRLGDQALVEDHVLTAIRTFYELNSSNLGGADK